MQCLQDELPSQQFNTWIRPLQVESDNANAFCLTAPNRFVKDWVNDKYVHRIRELVIELSGGEWDEVELAISQQSRSPVIRPSSQNRRAENNTALAGLIQEASAAEVDVAQSIGARQVEVEGAIKHDSYLIENYTFNTFVEGKSNQLARAAARQVAENPGGAYNPLFLYGGVGLGKTHLMHAVGNALVEKNPDAKVVYLHSERFVADMVKALQLNAINDFKRYYRSVDALLIDDIQFFRR